MNRVGAYEIRGELGRGGMGVVYRARREGADHDVALKVIAAGEDASPEALARFQREVRIAKELEHSGLATVFDAGQEGDTVWFAMELIDGEPLSQQIKEREFTWKQAVTIVRDVADALTVAHDRGVLHRDIKPGNILIDAAGKPHLTDFGLAKDTRTESKHTRTGQTLGTPAYMSPEQAKGELAALTPASDVWSLGCVLFEMLMNRPAFEGDTPAAVVGAILTTRPRVQDCPPESRSLLRVAMSPAAAGRPRDARELAAICSRALRGELAPPARPRAKRALLAAVAGAVAVAAVAGGWWLASGDAGPGPEAPSESLSAAEQAWRVRHTDPAHTESVLSELLKRDPNAQEWRVRRGLIRWSRGRFEDAASDFRSVPTTSDAYSAAQLYLGLEAMARLQGWKLGAAGVERHLESAATGRGRHARLAKAALLMVTGRREQAAAELRGLDGWEHDMIRATLGQQAGEAGVEQALGLLDRIEANGMSMPWIPLRRIDLKKQFGDVEGALTVAQSAAARYPRLPQFIVRQAQLLDRLERWDEAADLFTAALRADPKSLFAYSGLARIAQIRKQWAKAEQYLTAGIQALPTSSSARLSRADFYLRRKRIEQGVADLQKAIALDPRNADAWGTFAFFEAARRRMDVAKQMAEKAIALDPRCAIAWEALGVARHAQHDLPGAISALERAVALGSDRAVLFSNLALVLRDANEPARALERLDEAIHREPNNVVYRSGRADLLTVLGRFEEAVQELGEVLRLNPSDATAYNRRAYCYIQLGRQEEADRDNAAAVRLDPDRAELHYNKGVVLGERAQFDAAFECYNAALARDPKHARSLVNRGHIHLRRGNLAAARADYDAAIAAMPTLTQAWSGRASLRAKRGDLAGAEADYGRLLELDPNNIPIRRWRWNRRIRRGDNAGILEDLTVLVKLQPEDVTVRQDYARSLSVDGRHQEAAEHYRIALKLSPRSTRALLGLGISLKNIKQLVAARGAFDRGLAIDPKHVNLLGTRGGLSLQEGKFREAIVDFEKALSLAPPGWQYHSMISRNLDRARAGIRPSQGK